MAKILEFRAFDLECEDRTLTVDTSKTAEVIVFPGVRYERLEDGQVRAVAGSQGSVSAPAHGPTRDFLELAD